MPHSAIQFGRSPLGRASRLEAELFLPYSRERVFEFFSDAYQLESLTPPWLRFAVVTPPPIHLASGTLIDYRLRVHGVPLRWQSRIESWDPPRGFVDVQTRGPYRLWRHEHTFEEADGGVLCRDVVDYAPWGGWLVDKFLVRRDLRAIFGYRTTKPRELFPTA